ncbi:alcohol dehydrogenase [Brucella suis]|nr:alcohol dehydrogenase [Brucella suis]
MSGAYDYIIVGGGSAGCVVANPASTGTPLVLHFLLSGTATFHLAEMKQAACQAQ